MYMETNLTFSAALVRLKKQDDIARADWEEGVHLEISKDGTQIFKMLSEGEDEEWTPTVEDILAEDWAVVKEAE